MKQKCLFCHTKIVWDAPGHSPMGSACEGKCKCRQWTMFYDAAGHYSVTTKINKRCPLCDNILFLSIDADGHKSYMCEYPCNYDTRDTYYQEFYKPIRGR